MPKPDHLGWWLVGMLGLMALGIVVVTAVLRPVQSGTVTAPVAAPVQISFDKRARPYVQAETFADAFFAQGWLHARDRLWQMELFRRAGKGRLAQLLGPSALSTDIEMWRSGVPTLAERLQAVASDELKMRVAHYVAGVNTWISAQRVSPVEFMLLGSDVAPWTSADVFALGALMAYQSGNNRTNELVRLALVQKLGVDRAGIFFPREFTDQTSGSEFFTAQTSIADVIVQESSLLQALVQAERTHAATNPLFSAPAMGSNSWAVAAHRADSGNALFAFDSHDELGLPNLTYDVHLFVGEQQIRGASVPGLLGVINGFNEFMAWGFTNIGDSQDLYVETVDPANSLRFKGRDGWYQARVETTEIPVQGAPAHALSIVYTENGRLVSEQPPISMRWAPLEPHAQGLDALLQLNRATSFAAFNQAMDEFVAPSANVTYADVTGRVAQRSVGLLPLRGAGAGLLPQDGAAPDTAWQRMLAAHELPRLDLPQQDYVYAANQPFHAQGASQQSSQIPSQTPSQTPSHIGRGAMVSADNAPGYRVERIGRVLRQQPLHSVTSMQRLQNDHFNLQARKVLPAMLITMGTKPQGALAEQVMAMLQVWLRQPLDTADAPEPLIFHVWYQHLIESLFRESLGEPLYGRLLARSYLLNEAIDKHLLNGSSTGWPIKAALLSSFHRTLEQLSSEHGADPRLWRWGDHHQLHLTHTMSGAFTGSQLLFDRSVGEAPGGNATVGRARFDHRAPFRVSGGATSRMVLEMSQPIQAYMIMPGGQSGRPSSQHYNDQSQAWLSGAYDDVSQPPAAPVSVVHLIPDSNQAGASK